jgi:hypothetical protein
VNAVDFAGRIGLVIARREHIRGWNVWPSIISLIWLLFWILLTVKALLPQPEIGKVRKGYRRAGKG